VAASVLLIMMLYLSDFYQPQQIQSYEEKVALLNEAKEMLFNQKNIAQQNIIYEDHTIIIYIDEQ
jgi:hypothetical protein